LKPQHDPRDSIVSVAEKHRPSALVSATESVSNDNAESVESRLVSLERVLRSWRLRAALWSAGFWGVAIVNGMLEVAHPRGGWGWNMVWSSALMGAAIALSDHRTKTDDRIADLLVTIRETREAAALERPRSLESVLDALRREVRALRNRGRMTIWGAIVLSQIIIVLMSQTPIQPYILRVVNSALPLVAYLLYRHIKQRGRDMIAIVARHDDVRAIAPLIEVAHTVDRETGRYAEHRLAKLLTQLKASDAGLLNDHHRRQLDRMLQNGKDPDLTIAILNAYEQIGDKSSLSVVERLAVGRGRGRRDRRIREAAMGCLPYLRARAQAERDAQTLLRPASGPGEADPAVLLRPAEPGRSSLDD
jgi:hypothetical protein